MSVVSIVRRVSIQYLEYRVFGYLLLARRIGSSGWVSCYWVGLFLSSGQVSGVIRGGDLSGEELALVSAKIISTQLKDTARCGREVSTRSFLGRARVRDNLDIGYRASVIFGTSEVMQGWTDLRCGWSSSFLLEQQVSFGASPAFCLRVRVIVNKKICWKIPVGGKLSTKRIFSCLSQVRGERRGQLYLWLEALYKHGRNGYQLWCA